MSQKSDKLVVLLDNYSEKIKKYLAEEQERLQRIYWERLREVNHGMLQAEKDDQGKS